MKDEWWGFSFTFHKSWLGFSAMRTRLALGKKLWNDPVSSCFLDCPISYLVFADGTSFLLGSTLCSLHACVLIKISKQFFEQSQLLGISTRDIFSPPNNCQPNLLCWASFPYLTYPLSVHSILKTVYTFLPCYEVGVQAAWSLSLLLAHSQSPIPFFHFPSLGSYLMD